MDIWDVCGFLFRYIKLSLVEGDVRPFAMQEHRRSNKHHLKPPVLWLGGRAHGFLQHVCINDVYGSLSGAHKSLKNFLG